MQLKRTYSSREVSALTGLSARQLQWWDARRLFLPTVGSQRTSQGGFTERRYSPVDLIELLALADLRRQGFSVQKIRLLLHTLRQRFGVRLFDAIGGGGTVTLLTGGREIYARSASGEFFNLLRSPDQPLLAVGEEAKLKVLRGRARARRRRQPSRRAARSEKP